MTIGTAMETMGRDLRQAARALRRRPGFAITAIASLALGIGANSAIFRVVDQALVRALPVPESERLVVVKEFRGAEATGGNPARLRDWAGQVAAFSAAGGFYGETAVWKSAAGPVRLQMVRTFGPILGVMGVRPALGRAFTQEELRGEGGAVALLSDGAWRRHFGADATVAGRPVTLNGAAFTVIGVLPPELGYPEAVDVWAPAGADVQRTGRQAAFLDTIGRLQPGVTLEQTQAQVDVVAARLRLQYPETDRALRARLVRLRDEVSAEVRTPLLALQAAAALVLLLACVNLTSLLLARAAERGREASIRAALGAGRAGLVRLFLSESALLAAGGAALSLVVAEAGLDLLRTLLPESVPQLTRVSLDARAVGFAGLLAAVCALVVGLAPAWQASRADLTAGWKQRDGTLRAGWFRGALVVVQVGLSVVLVVGAGLLAVTFERLRATPLGFQPEQVLTVMVEQPWDTDKAEIDRFQAALLQRFQAIPGVVTAGFADRLPLEGGSQTGPVRVDGRTLAPALQTAPVGHRGYGGDYFQAMKIPLLQGMWPHRKDEVLVNRTFARRYFPDGQAVGQRVTFDRKQPKWLTVSGVVGDTRKSAAAPADAEVYCDMSTVYWPMARYALRAQGEPAALARAVRAAVAAVDPGFLPSAIQTMEAGVEQSVSAPRTRASLSGGFAVLALLLAGVGLNGLLVGEVARRRQEIGLRIALGARPGDIFTMTLRQGARLAGAGLLLGMGGALVVSAGLGSLLYAVEPRDAVVYAAAALAVIGAATAACLVPARRAAGVDPMAVLRHE